MKSIDLKEKLNFLLILIILINFVFNFSSDTEPLLSTEDMLNNMGQEIEHLLSKVNNNSNNNV